MNPEEESRGAAAASYGSVAGFLHFGANSVVEHADVICNVSGHVRACLEVPLRPESRSETTRAEADSSSPQTETEGEAVHEISADELMNAADQPIDDAGLFRPAIEHQVTRRPSEERNEG
ncbi:hypothetical protein QAD02_007182 [Eretmocerus hayati]|uniref:Uncharacterized protein n=1 Tax=Eretmocerus hayati TaxID=131215 RepID=A0ACC2N792_9HYME|nr:hypothetical protein QAD02_007182 [Eretmocerus hayati]